MSQITISLIDVEIFGKNTVFDVRELPTVEHTVRVHRVSRLRLYRLPIGCNRRHYHLIARFEVFDQATDFDHFGRSLMSEYEVMTVAQSVFPNSVYVRRTWRNRQRTTNSIIRTADRSLFFDKTYLVQSQHCKCFHIYYNVLKLVKIKIRVITSYCKSASLFCNLPRSNLSWQRLRSYSKICLLCHTLFGCRRLCNPSYRS